MPDRKPGRVVPKASSYTVTTSSDGNRTHFTNEGATGPITFTLPAANAAVFGFEFFFDCVVDQNLIVAPPVADTAIALNDTAADSLALQTAGQRIGGTIKATCVRTGGSTFQWLLQGLAVGHTYTVAT